MKTVLIKFYSPSDIMGEHAKLADPTEIRNRCFKVYRYSSQAKALEAYANSPAEWSTLVEHYTDVSKWIDYAFLRILTKDLDWLEENFT